MILELRENTKHFSIHVEEEKSLIMKSNIKRETATSENTLLKRNQPH